jgi:PqqD family protein of HPr-rel-A system
MQWRTLRDNALRFQVWNEEFVVYNEVSGDTHVLEEAAARLLIEVQRAPSDVLSLAQRLADEWQCEVNDDFLHEIEMALANMHALCLVECS